MGSNHNFSTTATKSQDVGEPGHVFECTRTQRRQQQLRRSRQGLISLGCGVKLYNSAGEHGPGPGCRLRVSRPHRVPFASSLPRLVGRKNIRGRRMGKAKEAPLLPTRSSSCWTMERNWGFRQRLAATVASSRVPSCANAWGSSVSFLFFVDEMKDTMELTNSYVVYGSLPLCSLHHDLHKPAKSGRCTQHQRRVVRTIGRRRRPRLPVQQTGTTWKRRLHQWRRRHLLIPRLPLVRKTMSSARTAINRPRSCKACLQAMAWRPRRNRQSRHSSIPRSQVMPPRPQNTPRPRTRQRLRGRAEQTQAQSNPLQ